MAAQPSEPGHLHQTSEDDSYTTRMLPLDASSLGVFQHQPKPTDLTLDSWTLSLSPTSTSASTLRSAAAHVLTHTTPLAFPTETVYGLGADATSSAAVRGIFSTKRRPTDNPLIIHIASLSQLRSLLHNSASTLPSTILSILPDPIPEIYHPLIRRFWPGPLTILLRLPPNSPLAPETTAGQHTFGARMPAHLLALALIHTTDRPIAAPSANASTRPSPTAAEHVLEDLRGRIEMILDGGPCSVGVESTVVDGLGDVPVVLRPGGIGLSEIRSVPGWEATRAEWATVTQGGPRAPGMKYRHYAPRARVVLVGSGREVSVDELRGWCGARRRVGVVRTRRWARTAEEVVQGQDADEVQVKQTEADVTALLEGQIVARDSPLAKLLAEQRSYAASPVTEICISSGAAVDGTEHDAFTVCDVNIGPGTADVARYLFSALRDLDRLDVDAIVVEGIPDGDGAADDRGREHGREGEGGEDLAAAIMNRLRKAAEVVLR